MSRKEIPDSAIELVAKHIDKRSNKNYGIPVIGHEENIEAPQIFEIIPFNQIDDSDRRFYVIDGYWYERWVTPRLDTLQTNLGLYPDQE